MDPVIVENYRNKVLNRKKEPIKGYDEKCDIWSVGTVCYELIIGNKIFDSKTLDDLWDKINEGRYILPKTLSQESKMKEDIYYLKHFLKKVYHFLMQCFNLKQAKEVVRKIY